MHPQIVFENDFGLMKYYLSIYVQLKYHQYLLCCIFYYIFLYFYS